MSTTVASGEVQGGKVERRLKEAASRIIAGTTLHPRPSRTKSGIIKEAGVSRSQAYVHGGLLSQLEASLLAVEHGEDAVSLHHQAQTDRIEHQRQQKEWSKQRKELEEKVQVLAQQVQVLTLERESLRSKLNSQAQVTSLPSKGRKT